ncbi:MAG: hypothetical protein J5546_09230, partial [Lachnospiraceae bacterium]|nr:hypothetical protein [Lachnospiraceae bacterium]
MATIRQENDNANLTRRINAILRTLKKRSAPQESALFVDLIVNLDNRKNHPEAGKIKPLSLYLDVLETYVVEFKGFKNEEFVQGVETAEKIYEEMFPLADETPGFEESAPVFLALIRDKAELGQGFFNFHLFS